MGKPSMKAVEDEIRLLLEIKPSVLKMSSFGDDHHAAIDAQVDVLSNDLDADEIYSTYEDDHNAIDNALEARDWMDGTSDCESLVGEWKSLVRA